jgi:hypothetical protein
MTDEKPSTQKINANDIFDTVNSINTSRKKQSMNTFYNINHQTDQPEEDRVEELDDSIVIILKSKRLMLSSNEFKLGYHGMSVLYEAIFQRFDYKAIIGNNHNESDIQSIQRALFASASILYHRYIYGEDEISRRNDVWSIGMASLLLASKLHDIPLTIKYIIHTFCIIYRKRVLLHNNDNIQGNISEYTLKRDKDVNEINFRIPNSWKQLSYIEQQQKLNDTSFIHTLFSTRGEIYKDWYDAIVDTECLILSRLGYRIHWIPDYHVYQYVESFCSRIRFIPIVNDNNKKSTGNHEQQQQQEQDHSILLSRFVKTTYEYCHKAMKMYLCIQYIPHIICCGAICCSAHQLHYHLEASIQNPDATNKNNIIGTNITRDWWKNLWDYSMDDIPTIQNDINKAYNMIWDLSYDSDYIIGNHFFIIPDQEDHRTYYRNLNIPGTSTWAELIDGDDGMFPISTEQQYVNHLFFDLSRWRHGQTINNPHFY